MKHKRTSRVRLACAAVLMTLVSALLFGLLDLSRQEMLHEGLTQSQWYEGACRSHRLWSLLTGLSILASMTLWLILLLRNQPSLQMRKKDCAVPFGSRTRKPPSDQAQTLEKRICMWIQTRLKRFFSGSSRSAAGDQVPTLVIPDGATPFGHFEVRALADKMKLPIDHIASVVVPGSVKSIGDQAFADFRNLQKVLLAEGVESLGSNVFDGCESLKSLQLPASLKAVNGWAFHNSGLTEPVFSADGKTLIYHPQALKASEYCVPEGTEVIGVCAFLNEELLTRVVLPKSLKRICTRAFIKCGFTEIEIPGDAVIEYNAFVSYAHGIRIKREKPLNALDERLELLYSVGHSFLYPQQMKAPQKAHWKEDAFLALAAQCASGSVDAMEKIEDYFLARAEGENVSPFYQCAAQFWQVRAYLYGSERAKRELLEWCIANPNARMTSPALDEHLNGFANGDVLNALGFPFFKPDREYGLDGVDAQGVVEVSSWESDEGPDEDGFGMEEYYDWWYLSEHLTLPEGAGFIHSCSNREKSCKEAHFRALHDQAVAACKA